MNRKIGWGVFAALALAVLLAGVLSPFASSAPDGLEKVAHDKGFMERGEGTPFWRGALMPDYIMPGVHHDAVATGMAGAGGTLLVFGVGYGLMKLRAIRARTPGAGRNE